MRHAGGRHPHPGPRRRGRRGPQRAARRRRRRAGRRHGPPAARRRAPHARWARRPSSTPSRSGGRRRRRRCCAPSPTTPTAVDDRRARAAPPCDRRGARSAALAALTILPLFLGGRGQVNADTKQYLYLDPVDLLERARSVWDSRVGGGAVTHQAIGYLWPMGPYYALMDALGLPDWAAQRLWIGGLQLVAALGALALFRHLLPRTWVHVPAAARLRPEPLRARPRHEPVRPPRPLRRPGLARARAWPRRWSRPGSWRWPAAFALIVTTCGSLNGSSVFFVVLAAVLWVPFAVGGPGAPGPARRRCASCCAPGALTLVTQVWWLVAYAVGGALQPPDPRDHRDRPHHQRHHRARRRCSAASATGSSTAATPRARGSPTCPRPTRPPGCSWSSASPIPILALAAGGVLRWRHRAYFTCLVGDRHAARGRRLPDQRPVARRRRLRAAEPHRRTLVLSLRNTQRAGALVALGLAGLLAAGLTDAPAPARAGPAPAPRWPSLVLVAGAPARPVAHRAGRRAVPPRRGPPGGVDRRRRPSSTRATGRVLELPGSDFATYRWGAHARPGVGRASPTARPRPRAGARSAATPAPTSSRPSTAACRRAGSSRPRWRRWPASSAPPTSSCATTSTTSATAPCAPRACWPLLQRRGHRARRPAPVRRAPTRTSPDPAGR